MKLKPTLWKTIVSLVVAVVLGIYAYVDSGCYDCPGSMIMKIKTQMLISIFLLTFIPIYGIWSVFQKRNNEKIIVWRYISGSVIVIIIEVILFFVLAFIFKSL